MQAKTTLVLVALATLTGLGELRAQEPSRGRLGISLGGTNAVTYDYSLGRHFEVGAVAGLGLGLGYQEGSQGLQYDGFTPTLEVAPRYFFSARDPYDAFHRGLYLACRFGAQMDQWILFPSKAIRESGSRYQYTLGFTPTVGWSMAMGETSFLRLGIGINFYRQKYTEAGVTFWRTGRGEVPLQLDIAYSVGL